MKFSIRNLALLPCLAAFLTLSGIAHAGTITGTVYQNIPNSGNAGDSANMSSSLPNATFTVGPAGINFTAPPSAYTPAGFLNNPVFTNLNNGFNASASLINTEIVLTGTIFLNAGANSFIVGHDDGVVLNIAGFGTVVNAPGPTSFSTSPFTVNAATAGNYSFTLDYSECCGPPADLEFAINNVPVGTTPEPSSFILLGSGLLAAAGVVRRRFNV